MLDEIATLQKSSTIQNLTGYFLLITTAFIAVEFFLSRKKNLTLYNSKDTLCNLGIFLVGKLSQPLFVGYIWTTLSFIEHFRLFTLPDNIYTTILAVILTDLAYYFEHRLSHTTRLLWFFHEVHHSSKLFNYTTSFRLHWLGRLTFPIIFAPLILLGFHAEQVVLFFILNLFYQFLLHTKTIGKLGPLEGVINTPSAHRVHHARNQQYLDKNFGGILIIWDRLFGTYAPEVEEPEFGVLGDFQSNNPFTVNFHKVPGYAILAQLFRPLVKKDKHNPTCSPTNCFSQQQSI